MKLKVQLLYLVLFGVDHFLVSSNQGLKTQDLLPQKSYVSFRAVLTTLKISDLSLQSDYDSFKIFFFLSLYDYKLLELTFQPCV
jgi:hypothetical protein